MRLLKYIQDRFLSKPASKWWRGYITGSDVIKGLAKFFLFCFVLQAIFYAHPIYALLIIFSVATLSFLYALIYTAGKILDFVLSELYPNDGLTGYFLIGLGGITFGSVILVPAFFAFSSLDAAPITWLSYIITYSYALLVWSFYQVSRSVSRNAARDEILKENAAHLKSVTIHQENQSEAIAELAPKTPQKINDLTAIKDIKKVAENDKSN